MVANQEVFDFLCSEKLSKRRVNKTKNAIKTHFKLQFEGNFTNLEELIHFLIKKEPRLDNSIESFLRYLEMNWNNSRNVFQSAEKNKLWLNGCFCSAKKVPGSGPPSKPYSECSSRSQRRKSLEIKSYLETQSPNRALVGSQKFIKSAGSHNNLPKPKIDSDKIISTSDSFDILTSLKYSKSEYSNLTKVLKSKGVLLKSYETIRKNFLSKSKSEIPITTNPDSVFIDPVVAISQSFNKIIDQFNIFDSSGLEFVIKFGFDGGESLQEINFQTESDQINDKYFFITAFTPLFLLKNNVKIWENPNPNSVDMIKPLAIEFLKENDKHSMSVFKKFQTVLTDPNAFEFNLKLFPTMMDQKSINACTILKSGAKGVDSHLCYLCGLRSSGKNSFQDLSKEYIANLNHLKHGLSPLHSLLNFTKFLIFNVSGTVNNLSKDQLNRILEDEYNVKFSEVRHGFGSKITGNICRMFLNDINKFSRVTRLPVDLIENVVSFVNAIRSRDPVDNVSPIINRIIDFFAQNSIHVTPTIHKLLFHSCEVIDFFVTETGSGTGFFSEEPMEGLIRKIRNIRRNNARKNSRLNNNYDTFVYSYIFCE